MIRDVTGIQRIRMLYIQLLYQCNFFCQHCFHGELLKATDSYSLSEVQAMLNYFRREYELQAVTLLGGEPLLHPQVVDIGRYAAGAGLSVEICTNGHFGFRRQLEALAPYLGKLRVSLEGLAQTNDRIRHAGSFASAMQTLGLARQLGIPTGVTMTVTSLNIAEVVPLSEELERRGVSGLKLHQLRLVGNAVDHPELFIAGKDAYRRLHEQIQAAGLAIEVRYDSDLSPASPGDACTNLIASDHLERIEVDPRGALTVSCKAVGKQANAFRWDTETQTVVYEPHAGDELALNIADVRYERA